MAATVISSQQQSKVKISQQNPSVTSQQQSETVYRSQQHIPVTSQQSAAVADIHKEQIELETRSRGGGRMRWRGIKSKRRMGGGRR